MKKALLWLWQLPQNIAGLLLIKIAKCTRYAPDGLKINCWKTRKAFIPTAVSLGSYIIVPERRLREETLILHEYGHSIQSRYLGPLYLLIVGLPSLFRNIYQRKHGKDAAWYYSGYPEKWANRLGGVEK